MARNGSSDPAQPAGSKLPLRASVGGAYCGSLPHSLYNDRNNIISADNNS